MAHYIDFDRLWNRVTEQFACGADSVHGPSHWKRVEKNGILLATRSGANLAVVRLFSLFHDSKRINEFTDEGHGERGAEFAKWLRGELFELEDAELAALTFACAHHTEVRISDDPTIGTCWDADRLDLGRVGIIPDARFMSTEFGREIAKQGTTYPFVEEHKR
jgi:uncharacterized protein